MTVVVDSNILIALSLADEPLHSHSGRLLSSWQTSGETLIAPLLFRSEITAVIRKVVYQGRITPDQGRILLTQLLAYPVRFYEDDALLREAFELAIRLDRPRAYDSQYLALAARFGCEVWTADERLYNGIRQHFEAIRWIGGADR